MRSEDFLAVQGLILPVTANAGVRSLVRELKIPRAIRFKKF